MRGAIGRVLVLLVPLVALLAVAAALPAPTGGTAVRVGPLERVTTVPFVFEPDVAVDPTDPDHLAATIATAGALRCASLTAACPVRLLFASSTDGGRAWSAQPLTDAESNDGVVYLAGQTAFVHQGPAEPAGGTIGQTTLPGIDADKPWLAIDPTTRALYVAYTGQDPEHPGPSRSLLARSADGARTWTETTLPPGFNEQPLLGRDGRVAVALLRVSSQAQALQGLKDVAVAASPDGGATFAASVTLGVGWGLDGSAWGGDSFYVAYAGTPVQGGHLTVAGSHDAGRTWRTAIVAPTIPLYYSPVVPAPALAVAPDGAVDLLFYAATAPCADPAAFFRAPPVGPFGPAWVDHCVYNVYHTASADGGQTWAAPLRLNPQPIVGARFAQVPTGRSRPGEYVGLAATDGAADALWIATDAGGTVADFVRIAR